MTTEHTAHILAAYIRRLSDQQLTELADMLPPRIRDGLYLSTFNSPDTHPAARAHDPAAEDYPDHAPGCVDDLRGCPVCDGTDPSTLDIDGIPLDSLTRS